MVIFDEKFFQELRKRIKDIQMFIQRNWIVASVIAVVLIVIIIFQQIILSFFNMAP